MDVENEITMKYFSTILFLIGLCQCTELDSPHHGNAVPSPDNAPDTITTSPETQIIVKEEDIKEKKKIKDLKDKSPLKGLTCDSILHLYRKDLEDYFRKGKNWNKVNRRVAYNDRHYKECQNANEKAFEAIDESLAKKYEN